MAPKLPNQMPNEARGLSEAEERMAEVIAEGVSRGLHRWNGFGVLLGLLGLICGVLLASAWTGGG
jgi:hypothetical protein